MSTPHENRRVNRIMHIFHTYDTLSFNGFAYVIFFHFVRHATLALVTVESLITATNSTKPTTFAVKYFTFFPGVIVKFTNFAKVTSEFNSTYLTWLSRFLHSLTTETLNLRNIMSLHFMYLIWILFIILTMVLHIVMTQSTCVEFKAGWAFQLASSSIVFAPLFRRLIFGWFVLH